MKASGYEPDRQWLGDSTARNYASKLHLFNAFAAPELQQAIASLALQRGMSVLDAGCGTGAALPWLAEDVGEEGRVVGLDLAVTHTVVARADAPPNVLVLQADLLNPPLPAATIDAVWSVNTINHVRDPLPALIGLASLLRPNGLLALGQSSFLPDMTFAWDARLEKAVSDAVYRYYRDRYRVSERDLTGIRALVGLLRQIGMGAVSAKTFVIERIHPIDAATHRYLDEVLFRGTWKPDRLRPYLSPEDLAQLCQLCDPDSPQYALRRPDFHFVQTFTVVTGRLSS